MRRAPLVLALSPLRALAGCASWNDRYGFVRTDPVLWFLGGAPHRDAARLAARARCRRCVR